LSRLESDYAAQAPGEVADHQKLYAQAQRMIHSPKMSAFDLSTEPDTMHEAYGKTPFAQGCLLARRLVETGVPFIEVVLDGWDTHAENFETTKRLGGTVDQPFAALLTDLAARGMLDKTLVVWMGEFGRTPHVNPRSGRDHFPTAFNVVLAGGGVRGGQVIGKTDAGGVEVTDRPIRVPDLFASFCHSLSIDPKKENTSSSGRPIKLVDDGKPIKELFS
jgi:uncharacterized protein (DUF1501 family)